MALVVDARDAPLPVLLEEGVGEELHVARARSRSGGSSMAITLTR